MSHVYLVRHCESVANEQKVYSGSAAACRGLSARGREQLPHLVNYMASREMGAVYSSPFLRARQTAEALVTSTTGPVNIVDEFHEHCCGEWDGRSEGEIQEKYPAAWSGWMEDPQSNPIPGGETLFDIQNRVLPSFGRICRRHSAQGNSFVIVTHFCIVNVLLSTLVASLSQFRSFRTRNASVVEVALERVPKLVAFLRPLPPQLC